MVQVSFSENRFSFGKLPGGMGFTVCVVIWGIMFGCL